MFLEEPPRTASAPNRRRGKFTEIVRTLMSEPDKFWNITEDINAALEGEEKDERYYLELARAISGGNRAAFAPKGAFEGRNDGKNIWAKFISQDKRKVVQADPAESDDPAAADAAADDARLSDADEDPAEAGDRELETV